MHTNTLSLLRGDTWKTPSFQAGFILLTMLAVSLVNMGVFVVILAMHVGAIVLQRGKWSRKNADYALERCRKEVEVLLLGFICTLLLHVGVPLLEASILRSLFILLLSAGSMFTKIFILYRALPSLLQRWPRKPRARARAGTRSLSTLQDVGILLVTLSLFIILVVVASVADRNMPSTILRELVPWKF